VLEASACFIAAAVQGQKLLFADLRCFREHGVDQLRSMLLMARQFREELVCAEHVVEDETHFIERGCVHGHRSTSSPLPFLASSPSRLGLCPRTSGWMRTRGGVFLSPHPEVAAARRPSKGQFLSGLPVSSMCSMRASVAEERTSLPKFSRSSARMSSSESVRVTSVLPPLSTWASAKETVRSCVV